MFTSASWLINLQKHTSQWGTHTYILYQSDMKSIERGKTRHTKKEKDMNSTLLGWVTVCGQVNNLSMQPNTQIHSAFYPLWDGKMSISNCPRRHYSCLQEALAQAIGLVQRSAASWHKSVFIIHQINWVKSCNGLPWWQHHKHQPYCCYYYYTIRSFRLSKTSVTIILSHYRVGGTGCASCWSRAACYHRPRWRIGTRPLEYGGQLRNKRTSVRRISSRGPAAPSVLEW